MAHYVSCYILPSSGEILNEKIVLPIENTLKQFAGMPKTSLSSNAFLIPVMTLVSDTIRRKRKSSI